MKRSSTMDRMAEAKRLGKGTGDWAPYATELQRVGLLGHGSIVTLQRGRRKVRRLLTKSMRFTVPMCLVCSSRMYLGPRQSMRWLEGDTFTSHGRVCTDDVKCRTPGAYLYGSWWLTCTEEERARLQRMHLRDRRREGYPHSQDHALYLAERERWQHTVKLGTEEEAFAWIAERGLKIEPPGGER